MSFNSPFAIPPPIPGDTEYRTSRISNLFPVTTSGPYTSWKLPVLAATTANITLQGLQTIDGVVLTQEDRVLVKNQTSGQENGIYMARSLAWARAGDLDVGSNASTVSVFINQGTINQDLLYLCTNLYGADIVGLDSLTWVPIASPVSNVLTQGHIFVGNASNVATDVPISGDAVSIANGVLTLSNTGVTAGTYYAANVTVSSTGRLITVTNGITGSDYQVQYALGFELNSSPLFTFQPLFLSAYGLNTYGTLTLGDPTINNPDYAANINVPNAVAASNTDGRSLLINSGTGDGFGAGGDIDIVAANGGNGGTTGPAGNINLYTYTQEASLVPTTITQGGISLQKVTVTLNTPSDPSPTMNTRQGIITILDVSSIAANSYANFTVLTNALVGGDVILLNVQNWATGQNGKPVVQASIVDGSYFSITLYNFDTQPMAASPIQIGFVIM